MNRARLALRALLGLTLAAACGENTPGAPRVIVAPILDSLFVGDTLPARTVRYSDARGDSQATGPVRWASSNPAVFTVDSVAGTIAGTGPGAAVLSARANGVTGTALLVSTRVLDVALLLDTIYLMPNDTFTVPVSVRDTSGFPPPVWFETGVHAVFTIHPTSGLVTATGVGGPLPFTVHADSVSVSGVVEVVQLTDTTGGKGSFSVLGTVIRRARSGARATHYRRGGDTTTFRVSLPVVQGEFAVENIVVTLRDSVDIPGVFAIDSISPNEAFGPGSNFVCRPARPWAIWSILTDPPLEALSGPDGSLSITQVTTVANGRAVSGRFSFTGRRRDLYDDPLAALPIRGTFVAPLITDGRRVC